MSQVMFYGAKFFMQPIQADLTLYPFFFCQ